MHPVQMYTPQEAEFPPDGPKRPIGSFNLQFLAQGDSWFTIGAFPPMATTNLFDGMATTVEACVVNCAQPGATLTRMTDNVRSPVFKRLLSGATQRRWSGLLVSGGGNDLIEALQLGPEQRPEHRLLAVRSEWSQGIGADRYVSNAGWATFSTHIAAVFRLLLAERDRGSNRGIPVVAHNYDVTVPRRSDAGISGPWIFPAVQAFGIPESDWEALARELMRRLAVLLDHIAATTGDGSLVVVHSQGTLVPARTTDTGATADWANEIHPSRAGYRRLGALWGPVIDRLFGAQPPTGAMDDEPLTLGELLSPAGSAPLS